MLVRVAPAVLAAILVVAAAGCSRGDDGTGLVPDSPEEREALVGTCLVVDDEVAEQVSSLPEVPCEEEHTHEIYAVVDFAAPATAGTTVPAIDLDYPGEEALTEFAEKTCHREFRTYVGIEAIDSRLFYSWMIPTLDGWNTADDRAVVCVVGDPASGTMQGSVWTIEQ